LPPASSSRSTSFSVRRRFAWIATPTCGYSARALRYTARVGSVNADRSMSIHRNPSIARTGSRILLTLRQYASSPIMIPHCVGLIERHASIFLALMASRRSIYSSTAASTADCSAWCSPRRFRIVPSPRRFASSARRIASAIVSPATHWDARRIRRPTAPRFPAIAQIGSEWKADGSHGLSTGKTEPRFLGVEAAARAAPDPDIAGPHLISRADRVPAAPAAGHGSDEEKDPPQPHEPPADSREDAADDE